jgi:PAS domain S-box-containing protein
VIIISEKGENQIKNIRGVTESKKTEDKLKESEEKFRTITEQSLMGICIAQDNKIHYVNDVYANIFGYTVEEMLSWELKDAFNAIHPEDREFALEQLVKKQKGDSDIIINYQYRGIHKSGKIIWVDQYSKPIIYGGKPANFITLVNIDERKRAEQKLIESEKKIKDERDNLINMLNSMEDGVYIINENYEIEFVNPSLKKEFGQIENKRCYEYFQDISEPCSWCKTQENITHGSIRWEWGSPITKKHYEITATPIKRAAGNVSKLVIFHDITKRKKAEDKMKRAREQADTYLNLAGVILVALNREGIITLMNKKGYEILEYEEGELNGKNWFHKCLPEDVADIVYQDFKRLIGGELEPIEFYENAILTKGKTERIIAWHNTLLYDKHGNIKGTLSSGEDITEHRRAEKELNRLSKLKSEMLTRTSHELKTPAMHIKGYADLLLHKYKDNLGIDELQIISHIKKGVLRLETLIYDILHKAELDSGQGELNKVQDNLSLIIELSVKELQSFADLRGHSIIMDIDDNMIIEFDKEQIRHVLNNLITNAIKYTPLSGIIGINSTITDDFITIAVQDNGIGLTEKQIKRLFTQFGKIERYGQGFDIITEGSGLGLHIAKRIMDLHEGRIWVESGGINKGSTFYFSLPRHNN